MDFKDLLGEAIQSKKKELDAVKASGSKYFRRSEIENIVKETEQIKELEVSEPVEDAPEEPSLGDAEDEVAVPEQVNESVERALKLKGEPIRLFGESDAQRLERLKILESKAFLKHEKTGQINDYMEKISELDKEKAPEAKSPSKAQDNLTAMHIEQISASMLKKEPEKARMLISPFLKKLVAEWESHLESEKAQAKDSKMNMVLYKQSKENLRPFFKLLKSGQLQPDVLMNVGLICMYMQNREYVSANDAYLKLAIGNAAWPIGVTMVGIHERSARERISSSQTAHALNDEVSRKWLQAIKRLITFCQTKYPPASRSQLMG